jgi:hypothetical protein
VDDLGELLAHGLSDLVEQVALVSSEELHALAQIDHHLNAPEERRLGQAGDVPQGAAAGGGVHEVWQVDGAVRRAGGKGGGKEAPRPFRLEERLEKRRPAADDDPRGLQRGSVEKST